MTSDKKATGAETAPFVISRTFDAPRDLVWKVFTHAEHLKNWWGPKGFVVRTAKVDFRVGGTFHYCIEAPNGMEMWGKFVYREIVPPERIVFVSSFSDENGGVTHHPMSPDWPLEMLSKFEFSEKDGKTTFTVSWLPWNATEKQRETFEKGRSSMQQGWTGTLDQLGEYLAKL